MPQRRKRRERRFHPGMKVRIVSDCRMVLKSHNVSGATATYEGQFDPLTGKRYRKSRAQHEDNVWTFNPRLRLEDGRVIWGYQCYWLPLSEALECEAPLDDVAKLKRRLQPGLQEKVGS
jgi:hypothetical protein